MSKLQGIFKLRVKIDGQEFEAEGPAELVRGQFEAFRAMMQEMSGREGAGLPCQNGNDLPDGTYFVVLTINGGAITRNGYVDLRR